MPKYQVMATRHIYVDAYVEADTAKEAYVKAQREGIEWVTVGGDFEIHEDCIYKESDDERNTG